MGTKAEELFSDIKADILYCVDGDMSEEDVKREAGHTYIESLLTGLFDSTDFNRNTITAEELNWLETLYNKYA